MIIKFLLDENIPYALIDFLTKEGFTVKHLRKMGKQGIKNGEVYQIAEKEKMWIVTRDLDFQNLTHFYSHNISGIIIFKLSSLKTDHLLNAFRKLLKKQKDKLSEKHLIIVEDHEVKIY